jgi:hypothetical protein
LGERRANDQLADVGAGALLAVGLLIDPVPEMLTEVNRDQVSGSFGGLHGMDVGKALRALQAENATQAKKVLETIPPASTVSLAE